MPQSIRALMVCCGIPGALCADMRFSDQALQAGVADVGETNGAAFGDYSGDGLPDLFVARLGSDADPLLYLNTGNGTFAAERQVVAGLRSTMGGIFVDYDSDGDLDLYTVHYREPDRLLDNEGGRLVLIDRQDAPDDNPFSMGAAFGDYDGDGRIDLFTVHRVANSNQYYTRVHQEGFVELSELHSALRSGRDSFGALPLDYDSDGDLDLYVSNLGFASLLYCNEGRGTFRQIARAVGLLDEGWSLASFPGDYDNDGDLDLYTIRARSQANGLYAHTDGHFAEVEAGVAGSSSSTGAAWGDYDNDGDLDLLVSNLGAMALYENRGDGTFADVSVLALPPSTQVAALNTGGVTTADYDADGDVDVFLGGLGTADFLLRNDSPPSGWLRVELVGRPGQTALGSRVRVRTGDGAQLREYAAVTQIGTAHGSELHFGLGVREQVDIEVDWASGQRQVLTGVAADQVLRLREPIPGRDLAIDAVLEPGQAPRWRATTFEVAVRNVGAEAIAGARLTGRVEVRNQVQYEQVLAVPTLAAGESARLRFPEWTPRLGGAHRFVFALEGDDEVAANNSWARVHSLHRFVDVAPRLGVADRGPGFAAAWTDYDRDGDLDLYVSNGATLGAGTNALYRNDEDAGFTEVGKISGVADDGNGTGVVFADFDRDGWEDLFISKGGFTLTGQANRLFHNNRDGTFADVSVAAGLDEVLSSYAAVAGDYDQDGYTDLYVSQFRGQPNQLYHNSGNGEFEEVGRAKGIVSFFNYGGSAASFADFDSDGDVDLYASIFGTYDVFYAEVGAASFGVSEIGAQGNAVGMAAGDYDNDGDLDVYVINQSRRSALSRNDLEAATFVDIGEESGTDNLALGAGCAFGDYDSDGDLDLFVVNGGEPDRVFMNRGDGTFVNMATAYGMADTSWAWAVALGDYDNDGDLDAYVVNEKSTNRLYQNGSADYNWLQVGVRGVESNTEGIGARIQLFAGERVWMREVNGTAGMSQSSRIAHFGLGETAGVDSLLVRWPSGRTERFVDVPANSRLAVVEGKTVTAVTESEGEGSVAFGLEANYPNPFNAETRIRFAVGERGMVRLVVYNALGQRVRGLVEREREEGRYEVGWNGLDDGGESVGSGVYFCRLQSGGWELTRSLVLLR